MLYKVYRIGPTGNVRLEYRLEEGEGAGQQDVIPGREISQNIRPKGLIASTWSGSCKGVRTTRKIKGGVMKEEIVELTWGSDYRGCIDHSRNFGFYSK